MVETICKENKNLHLMPVHLQILLSEAIMKSPHILEAIQKAVVGSHTLGVGCFDNIELIDGRIVYLLLEYDVEMMAPGLGAFAILGATISDRKMPDEFLDIFNRYKEMLVEGQAENIKWFQK